MGQFLKITGSVWGEKFLVESAWVGGAGGDS